jgi:uncharacterized membrane protein YdbT with pleckstrin-like domain
MLRNPDEQVFLDARRHGVVLIRPLFRALVLAALGGAAFLAGWPVSAAGAALLVVAAIMATASVWRWDRTHVVVTTEKLFVVHGIVRRRAAAVRLARVGTVEIEQSMLGRMRALDEHTFGRYNVRKWLSTSWSSTAPVSTT